jgi:hypothetical protein
MAVCIARLNYAAMPIDYKSSRYSGIPGMNNG